jgi:hypothetical protein
VNERLPVGQPMVEVVLSLYGLRVRLRAATNEGLNALVGAAPGVWRHGTGRPRRCYDLVSTGGPGRGQHILYRDAEEVARSADLTWVLAVFAGSIGFYVAEGSRIRTFVHAGVVGWNRRAILLPGRESTGKTTLTAALVRAGATYLSDEFAPIDDRGRVDPFPRPLTFKTANVQRPHLVSVESMGGVQERRALDVGLIVFAPYMQVKRWRPRRVSPGRGVFQMLVNCVSAQTRPQEALERLGRIATQVPVLSGGRGDADETAALILRRLDALLNAEGGPGPGRTGVLTIPKFPATLGVR